MKKLLKKIMPVIILSALIVLIGGFCDGLIASAQTSRTGSVNMDQMMATVAVSSSIMHQDALPMDNNALMPCCSDRHSATPTTQVNNFNAGMKFAVMDCAQAASNLDSFFQQKIGDISDLSPPKPDILSSVLKRE